MIGYLKGKVIRTSSQYAIVEVNNLGYQVYLPEKLLEKLKPGETVELHIYHHQTDKSEALYGFVDLASIRVFELLMSVSGVGPKAAVALLSTLSAQELEEAIIKGDADVLTTAPGIGKRGAQKIIASLSDSMAEKGIETMPKTSPQRQAYEALLELGYNAVEAKTALRMVDNSITDPEEKIKQALKHLG